MIIEAGKRYVRRDGKVSGKIITRISDAYPFFDPQRVVTYSAIGKTVSGMEIGPDLITEYKEPSMKEIDFKKPLWFENSETSLNYIGRNSKGDYILEILPNGPLISANRLGVTKMWPNVENVPEKITQWCNFYPSGSGGTHATRTEADRSATSERIACVPVTFELGEGL